MQITSVNTLLLAIADRLDCLELL